jgi:penicillin-binding protein 1A
MNNSQNRRHGQGHAGPDSSVDKDNKINSNSSAASEAGKTSDSFFDASGKNGQHDRDLSDKEMRELARAVANRMYEKKKADEEHEAMRQAAREVAAAKFAAEQRRRAAARTEAAGSVKTGSAAGPAKTEETAEKPSLLDRAKDRLSAEKEHHVERQHKEGSKRFRFSSVPEMLTAAGHSFLKKNPYYDAEAGDYVIVKGKRRRNSEYVLSAKYTVRNAFIILLAMILIFIVYAGVVILQAPKIDPSNIYKDISSNTIIYDDSGNVIESVNSGQNRTLIKYKDLNKDTVNAFVALEDKTFWTHSGFNWTRMIGAVLSSFRGGGISGTSTITQQLARNVYLPKIKSQRSIRRKILEMYYAARIEHSLSKKQIFTAYVNSIYFGFGCYGIDNAAKTYFSKDVKDLTLEESAALASLPQSPDTYALLQKASDSNASSDAKMIKLDSVNYVVNDTEKPRRITCLKLMKEQGYITSSEYREAASKDLEDFIDPQIVKVKYSGSSYFADYTKQQVINDLMDKYDMSRKNAANMVYSGGLKIYSTMDAKAQKAVEDGFSKNSNFPSLTGLEKDKNGNIVSSSGSITLYKYSNMFDKKKRFVLKKGEYKKNSNGSITLYRGHRLKLYSYRSGSTTVKRIEFKPSYTSGSSFYIYPDGTIDISSSSLKQNKNGSITISASYIRKHKDSITTVNGRPAFTEKSYTLQDKVIQPQAAMVITEVGTGEVKAMSGGRGISGRQLYNRAVNPRQPGSSIKPLAIYSAALQRSYEYEKAGQKFQYTDPGNDTQGTDYYGDYLTASSIIVDEPITIDGKVWPKNSDNTYRGRITMRTAMNQSVNVAAVKIYEQISAKYAYEMLKKYGISTISEENDMNPASLALGGLSKGISPYEMAEAYTTFPNGGSRSESRVYTKVVDSQGKTILKTTKKTHKVLDEGVAYIMTSMLRSVVTSGTGTNANISGASVGGKTGTTENNYDIWFCGITPKYSASLWIGTDVNIPLTSSSVMATSLWSKIMANVPGITSGSYKKAPADIVTVNGEYYTEGTEATSSSYTPYSSSQGSSSSSGSSSKKKSGSSDVTTNRKSSSDSGGSSSKDNKSSSGNSGGGSSGGNNNSSSDNSSSSSSDSGGSGSTESTTQ